MVGVGILFLCSYGSVYAIDNDTSVFIDDATDGGAKGVNIVDTSAQQKDALINVIKGVVNRVLGILALIALLVVMYGGFSMVTSAGDEKKYETGFTILKYAATGLILIGVARFVISITFWLVNKVTESPGPANTASYHPFTFYLS